jgi:hypothetical protein
VSCTQEAFPSGWKPWTGPVPPQIVDNAIAIRDHVRQFYKKGSSVIAQTMTYNGTLIGFLVNTHTWTWRNGKLLTGLCIPGVSVLVRLPTPAEALTPTSSTNPLAIPDPNLATWTAVPETTDWPLVGAGLTAIAATVTAFFLALKHAGRAQRPRLRSGRA